ncbi:unnamed protein product [Cunninghamella echinulata]
MCYHLIKQGHSVYIFDKKNGPTDQSRAFFITPRSLEILQQYGVASSVLKRALCIRAAAIFINGSSLGDISVEEADTIFPQLTSLQQSKIEEALVEELEKFKGAVQWQHTLQSYQQHDDHVSAKVMNDITKETIDIEAKYIVGADGCHSFVRKQDPTWTYDGTTIKTKFALADVILTGDDVLKIKNRQTAFYHSIGGCIMIPMPMDLEDDDTKAAVRIVCNMGPYDVDTTDRRVTQGFNITKEEFTLEKLKEIMAERLQGLKVEIEKPIWLTYFGVNERMANGFRRQRAFLIGDAAHCHSPVGGQGMNIGFQDADNLAWKLSVVLKGGSSDPEKLLESYTIEREPMVKSVLESVGSASRIAFAQSPILSFFRQAALYVAFSIPMVIKSFADRFMQIDFHLGESPILSSKNKSTLIQPGQYIKETRSLVSRDASIDISRKTVYQILENFEGKHGIFFLLTRHSWQKEPHKEMLEEFIQGISKYEKTCQGLVAQSITQYPNYFDGKTKKKAKGVDYWIDTHAISSSDSLSSRLGFTKYLMNDKTPVPPAAFIVVRPDRYVAYSQLVYSKDDLIPAFEFLNTYLC